MSSRFDSKDIYCDVCKKMRPKRSAKTIGDADVCGPCYMLPREGDRVFLLDEDGHVRNEATYEGYYIMRPEMSEVKHLGIGTYQHPTALIVPQRAYKDGLKKNPSVTKTWLASVKRS